MPMSTKENSQVNKIIKQIQDKDVIFLLETGFHKIQAASSKFAMQWRMTFDL